MHYYEKKKVLALLLSMTCAFSAVPCIAWADEGAGETLVTEAAETEAPETEAPETEAAEDAEADADDAEADGAEDAASEASADVMTYEEFAAADPGTEVVIETYVQAVQAWADGTTTIYAQDEDGAYLIDQVECAYATYETLEQGVQIKVTGIKSGLETDADETDADDAETEAETEAAEDDAADASSEDAAASTAVRITDAAIEVEDGSYVAEAVDVTGLLGTDELAEHQNEYVSFSGMTIVAFDDGEIFHYGKDGSGEDGDDLYFNASYNGETYTFEIAVGLCDISSVPYNFTKILEEGYVLDMSGFLCWDEDGAVPHINEMQFSE